MKRIVLVLIATLSLASTAAFAQDAAKSPAPGSQQVNLNSATALQLEALPGIGRSTAEKIIEYRQKSGGFKKVEDLMNVQGIGEKNFLKLKPLVTVSPSRSERPAQ